MSWMQVIFVSLLATLLILTRAAGRVFVPEADAATFFKRRGRRSIQYYYELQAEQRVRLVAAAHRREALEEQKDKYENYAEEVHDEQNERSRETNEQYREFRYDGNYPRYWRE
ncbi:hypothetical protein CRUP_030210 [Coryphaenoides rupestris]|nr:hypothetical protein CRUP_030210 [Coryphaenoides rupestris]